MLPGESGWTFLCTMGGRRNHPAGAPRGAAQPLMEGDKGSDAFLHQKTQLFLSATSLCTAVQTVPLSFPPLCPLRAQTTFNSRVVCGFFVLDLQYFSNNNNNKVVASLCAGCCQTSQSCLQHGNGLRAMTARGKVSCKRDQEEVCELLAAPSPAVRVRKSGEVLLVSDCCFTSSGWTLLAGTLFQFLNYLFRNLLIFLHLCPFIVNMFSSSADSHRSKLHDTPGVTESEAVHDVFS